MPTAPPDLHHRLPPDDPYADLDHDPWDDRPNPKPAPTPLLQFVDWNDAFNAQPISALVDSFLVPGRWTAVSAEAKTGKSTLSLHVAHSLARGIDPFTGSIRTAVPVLYIDAEMGRIDMVDRLRALELHPSDLDLLYYCDLPPIATDQAGATAIISEARNRSVELVIIDGINGVVAGAENDDQPWRDLYRLLIGPLKRHGIAVYTNDNTGKDASRGMRGSSVKADKCDAAATLKQTEGGCEVAIPRRRTHEIATFHLTVVGADGSEPISYRNSSKHYPARTAEIAAELDRLGVDREAGRDVCREALTPIGVKASNDLLSAVTKYRKSARYRTRTGSDSTADSPTSEQSDRQTDSTGQTND